MEFLIITLFPQIFPPFFKTSIIGRAVKKKLIKVKIVNLKDFALNSRKTLKNSHKIVDDRPFGGGQGMVIRPDVALSAIVAAKKQSRKPTKTILLTPAGKLFNQKTAEKFAKFESLVIFCGHYEGVDERVANFTNFQISAGDYILTGGETAAIVLIDSITRLIPQVLPKLTSEKESFANNLLAAPVYTRPVSFGSLQVPKILLSGKKAEIDKWKKRQRILKTKMIRPDLFEKYLKAGSS